MCRNATVRAARQMKQYITLAALNVRPPVYDPLIDKWHKSFANLLAVAVPGNGAVPVLTDNGVAPGTVDEDEKHCQWAQIS